MKSQIIVYIKSPYKWCLFYSKHSILLGPIISYVYWIAIVSQEMHWAWESIRKTII